MPHEAERGFKINGNWYDGREFLREDCARVHSRTDMRRRGSDQNLQLDYEQKRQEETQLSVYPRIGRSKKRPLTKFASDDLVPKTKWMNAHLAPGRGLLSGDVFRTVMQKELERAERLKRMRSDRGIIANLQVLELDLFMDQAIKM